MTLPLLLKMLDDARTQPRRTPLPPSARGFGAGESTCTGVYLRTHLTTCTGTSRDVSEVELLAARDAAASWVPAHSAEDFRRFASRVQSVARVEAGLRARHRPAPAAVAHRVRRAFRVLG